MDRYGRIVAEVVSDTNLNLALVEDGQAFAYRQSLGKCNGKEYLNAEYRASRSRFGVWAVPGGITKPWDFGRARRPGGRVSTASTSAAPAGSTQGVMAGHHYRCKDIGSFARAQELLRQGHTYLDGGGDVAACEYLR